MLRYFWTSHKFRLGTKKRGTSQSESALERRFRKARDVFLKVIEACFGGDGENCGFLRRGLRKDAIGGKGISPIIQVFYGHLQLSYVIPTDFCDDAFEICKTTASILSEFLFQCDC